MIASGSSSGIEICRVVGLHKNYGSTEVLGGIDLELEQGQLTALVGASGSGKSTLMNCIAGLDSPTSGTIEYAKHGFLDTFSENELMDWRAKAVGFILQQSNLIGGLTVKDNIKNPSKITQGRFTRRNTSLDIDWLLHLTDSLGVTSELDKRPHQLSGGQQQRVAIARALAHKPEFVFADEPTASLDTVNRASVYKIIKDLTTDNQTTAVIVAHDEVVTSPGYADQIVTLSDGLRITEQGSVYRE